MLLLECFCDYHERTYETSDTRAYQARPPPLVDTPSYQILENTLLSVYVIRYLGTGYGN